MQCPRCASEQPVWARYCMQCGETMVSVPGMQPPAAPPPLPGEPRAVAAPAEAPAPDLRAQLAIGAVLAFVATLVVPPLTGGIAIALGYRVYARGVGDQRRKGLLLMVGGAVGMAVGLAIALYVDQAGILPT